MVKTKSNVIQREAVVVKFVGDSGDGMQLTGTLSPIQQPWQV